MHMPEEHGGLEHNQKLAPNNTVFSKMDITVGYEPASGSSNLTEPTILKHITKSPGSERGIVCFTMV